MISKRKIDCYKEQGFVVIEDLIPKRLLIELRTVVNKLVDSALGIEVHNEIFDLERTHTPLEPRVRRIKTPHKLDEIFWRVLRHSSVLNVLHSLIGNNVRLHGSKLNIKAPRYGAPVEWHQDWAFYPHTNDDILAIGLMLDDVEDDNGPMLAIPGTHKRPKVWDHHMNGNFCGAINLDNLSDIDFSSAVSCTGPAGSCSFHHVRLVHGSAQNRSNNPRHLLLYECAAADSWPLLNFKSLDEFDSRLICGNSTISPRSNYAPIRMPYPPAVGQGSIYENQSAIDKRYFEIS